MDKSQYFPCLSRGLRPHPITAWRQYFLIEMLSKCESHRQREGVTPEISRNKQVLVRAVGILMVSVIIPQSFSCPVLCEMVGNRTIRLVPRRVQRAGWRCWDGALRIKIDL